MRQLLFLLALGLLMSSTSCATSKGASPGVTPAPWKRHYHHAQRKNERQRRRIVKPNITWRGL